MASTIPRITHVGRCCCGSPGITSTPAPTSSTTNFPVDLPTTQAPAAKTASGDEGDTIWLDAAWEIAVTIIAAAVTAIAAGVVTVICKRRRVHREPPEDAVCPGRATTIITD